MKSSNNLKIALVYDWVTTEFGGAEKVLLALHQLYPEAPLFTTIYNPQIATWAKDFKIKTSFLQKLPKLFRSHRLLAPLMPLAFEQLDLSEFDLIISITSASAKGIITLPDQLHICYLLTPPRFVYTHRQTYLSHLPFSNLLEKISKPFFKYAQRWDLIAASRPDVIIPISKLIQKRVAQTYHRQSGPVIYPPVSFTPFTKTKPLKKLKKSLLVVSRLVPYKRIDLAIKASLRLKKPLIIVGEGPHKNYLQKISAGVPWIKFVGHVSKTQLEKYYSQAEALLMPAEEDFGITALESLAHHTPVILHHQSGAAELIQDYKTGLHLPDSTTSELVKSIQKLASFKPQTAIMDIVVAKHSTASFLKSFKKLVSQSISNLK